MINLVLTLLVACASFTLALHQIHFDTTNEDASNLNLDWGRGYLKGHTQAKQSYVQDWSGERQTDDDKELLNVVPLPGAPAAADEEQVANSLDSVAKLATDKTPTFLNVKLSLSLWDNVDRMFTAMLQRARQSPRLTLKDRGTHSVAVMSTIVNLANNLLERCS
ncbi:uncharacterized protein LOC132904393 [Amyelois transitella]|uniref:uncharacterized protein LOC132904393 n=1 Tax=Amyelois transitella TaxID=680683 RepID=UPI0029907614|nr:uncharacterized protein LOC132904393 [Amyelois transitella]